MTPAVGRISSQNFRA